ncbi:MAG: ATP synthase delta/epsilon chain alpha-helix domain-containing protein [Clostridium celatum]|uniref:ATP synthase delta/epsilon chain alpha-helix domain-containing protein n=1 Tax=uncultured Clostridium sp. TaxID=59620 RepID=UPI0025E1FDC5|nr:ATP synthase delta/epsilon chain alpha-helix domain-containing protein [uncultured Clostridium sp.]MDU4882801.1 ATP synthase delta/epsilon chain alpha-helix domain-containing protein [Clostridium celatum]MDU5261233.1 ATP synthase delta/epsilon chain alpha-helix domain-containing protein [Clostridium celatum]MDU7075929.1 ATP synthase delta/epsilon chain alpha-helix domain-containing protein [Clostridium celatum]
MGKLIKLNIVAPGREVLTEEIVSLATTESDGKIEFLANYAPTIIATIPTITTYTTIDGNKKNLFTSSGIVYIKDNIINFCCDSFNFPEEIDRERAEQSLKRAQERLNNKEKNNIDIERAKRAEARAKARLELK